MVTEVSNTSEVSEMEQRQVVLAVVCFLVVCALRVHARVIPDHYYNQSIKADDLPTSVDWRARGVVLPPLDQQKCHCCWALATTASVESLQSIRTGKAPFRLSAQMLVDCDKTNKGCSGGSPRKAFQWIVGNGGITTEEDYPFVAQKQPCQEAKKPKHAVKITGYGIGDKTEAGLLRAVAAQPVVAGLSLLNSPAYKNYKSGIFEGPCGAGRHAVLVVGYGVNSTGTPYWIVKNSYGTSWGDNGFFLMKRGVGEEGLCGIASMVSYPKM